MRNRAQNELVKGLGVFGSTSVVAGTMIGTAIFVVPGIMLQQVGTPAMVLVVWVAAGVLSLFGALSYAELGAALPEAGGEFVYMHRAYGPLFGFLYGWTQFIIAKTASIAAIATGFVLYLAYFFPRLHETLWEASLRFGGRALELRLTGLQLGATLMVLLLSGLNILGVRRSGAVQTFFTASKILVLAVLIVLGLTYGHGSWQGFRPFFAAGGPGGLLAAFGVATVSALWAYDGWNNLSMVAGEVENPQRNVPRGVDCRGAAGSHRLCPGEPGLLLRAAGIPGTGHEDRGLGRRAPHSWAARGEHLLPRASWFPPSPRSTARSWQARGFPMPPRARAFSRPRWALFTPASTPPPCRWWGRPSSRDYSRSRGSTSRFTQK